MAITQFEANEIVSRANVNQRITQMNAYFPVSIVNGGTGGTSATGARTNLEVLKAYSLYSNSSGTYGTITLSDTYTNYDYIEIYFNDNSAFNVTKIAPSIASQAVLTNTYINGNGNNIFYHSALLAFSGTSATFSRNSLTTISKTPSVTISVSESTGVRVNKIIGYKY